MSYWDLHWNQNYFFVEMRRKVNHMKYYTLGFRVYSSVSRDKISKDGNSAQQNFTVANEVPVT